MFELTEKPRCSNSPPPWFVGHWRDWHRGHGCDLGDGKPGSEVTSAGVVQPATRKTAAPLNELVVRTYDALKARFVLEFEELKRAYSVSTPY